MKRLDKSEIIFKVLAYVLLTIFALMCVYPLIYIFSASISSKTAVDASLVILLPKAVNGESIQVDTYNEIFRDRGFWLSYCNTIFYTVFGTTVSMFVAITGAYALSKTRLMFKRGFNFILIFTMWFNAGIIPTYLNFEKWFKIFPFERRISFIIALGFNAFNIILLRSYFSSVPSEIEEAATIDGATEYQILTRIYIPMSKASIATVTMFYAIARWNGYVWASLILGDKRMMPLQVYLRDNYASDTDTVEIKGLTFSTRSKQYAALVCSIIPIIIIYPQISKYFAAGVNLGGVKE